MQTVLVARHNRLKTKSIKIITALLPTFGIPLFYEWYTRSKALRTTIYRYLLARFGVYMGVTSTYLVSRGKKKEECADP